MGAIEETLLLQLAWRMQPQGAIDTEENSEKKNYVGGKVQNQTRWYGLVQFTDQKKKFGGTEGCVRLKKIRD